MQCSRHVLSLSLGSLRTELPQDIAHLSRSDFKTIRRIEGLTDPPFLPFRKPSPNSPPTLAQNRRSNSGEIVFPESDDGRASVARLFAHRPEW